LNGYFNLKKCKLPWNDTTVWAADFETPAGSSTFFSFFSLATSVEIKNK
jgi:hypothetical protein